MSTSLIINVAFFVGIILSYKLIRKIIRDALIKKRKKDSILSCDEKEFKKKLLEYYESTFKECNDLEKKVKGLFNDICNHANSIVTQNKEKLNKELDDSTSARMKQISDRFTKAVGDVKANTANVAADAVKKIMNEYKNDDKHSNEIISSLSRDLNKKLH